MIMKKSPPASQISSRNSEIQAQSNVFSSNNQKQTQHKTSRNQGALVARQAKRQKRFRFTDPYDLFLLRAVLKEDAHLSKWGELEATYRKVLEAFAKHIPSTAFLHMNRPSTKTLIDRVNRLISMRRAAIKKNVAVSGTTEEFGEKESLLDDLILQIDEKAETIGDTKEERNENEQKLVRAGECIRQKAHKSASKTDESDSHESLQSKKRPKKRRKRSPVAGSDDAFKTFLFEQAKEKQRLDAERVKLERERLEIQQKESLRRLELEEKRFELEKRERMQAMEERSKLLRIMDHLSRKLQ